MNKIFLCLAGGFTPELALSLIELALVYVKQDIFELIWGTQGLKPAGRVIYVFLMILPPLEVLLRPVEILLFSVIVIEMIHVGRRTEARKLRRLSFDLFVGIH